MESRNQAIEKSEKEVADSGYPLAMLNRAAKLANKDESKQAGELLLKTLETDVAAIVVAFLAKPLPVLR